MLSRIGKLALVCIGNGDPKTATFCQKAQVQNQCSDCQSRALGEEHNTKGNMYVTACLHAPWRMRPRDERPSSDMSKSEPDLLPLRRLGARVCRQQRVAAHAVGRDARHVHELEPRHLRACAVPMMRLRLVSHTCTTA